MPSLLPLVSNPLLAALYLSFRLKVLRHCSKLHRYCSASNKLYQSCLIEEVRAPSYQSSSKAPYEGPRTSPWPAISTIKPTIITDPAKTHSAASPPTAASASAPEPISLSGIHSGCLGWALTREVERDHGSHLAAKQAEILRWAEQHKQ